MNFVDICPTCSVGRPSWLGGSHFRKVSMNGESKPACEIEESIDDAFIYGLSYPTWPVM